MFFKSLHQKLKSYINKRKILEDIDINKDILRDNLQVFTEYTELFIQSKRSLNKASSSLATIYFRNCSIKDNPKNMLNDITIKLARFSANYDTLEKFIDDNVRNSYRILMFAKIRY